MQLLIRHCGVANEGTPSCPDTSPPQAGIWPGVDVAGENRWGHRDVTAILLAYRHGLRASELVALRWDDIDFRTGKLHVRRAKGGTPSVHPLGGKELRALRRLQRETPEGARTVHVFVSERLALLSVAGYQRMVARAGKAARFPFLVHRLQAGQRRPGHLPGPPVDRLDGALHRAGTGPVQGVLEGLKDETPMGNPATAKARDRRLTIEEMRQHIVSFEQHGQPGDLVIHWLLRGRSGQAKAIIENVFIPPIRSELSYATALHEIGHIFGRYQRSRSVMVRERWAWEWARANALVWTPRMERSARAALAWYRSRAAKIDAHWRPSSFSLVDSPSGL
jgi:Phage integrase family